jgi:hypothetical protein
MSMAKLEREILLHSKSLFNNPKLTKNDILEWSTGEIKPENEKEVTGYIPHPYSIYVTVLKEKVKPTEIGSGPKRKK